MKKQLFIAAAALLALAGCSDDSFVGDQSQQAASEGGAISFNMNTPAITRAETKTGSDAATDLNYQFIIWGEKNEINTGETGANVSTVPGATGREGDLVFENYIVRWADNSAYTTTSNTKNWEYVGYKYNDNSAAPVTTNYSANITPNTKPTEGDPVVQTIKYWDFGASSYTFTAVSALPADISGNKVKIAKITSGDNVFAKGYNIELKSGASLDKVFISDRNNITPTGAGTDRNASNKYGGNVTMTFRNFMSKIRFGVYETIPGYKVKITKIYYTDGADGYSTDKFGVDGSFLVAGDNTAYTVSYYSANNKATTAIKSGSTPDKQDYFETAPSSGSGVTVSVPILTADNVGTSATTATYNKKIEIESPASEEIGAYTSILPFPSNTVNTKVRMDIRLISEDTNETIDMTEATAEIPAAYCQWLPNYAYTYILKINDNTDGHMGSFVGLYPITFDAVEIKDENGEAEYITTVSEPSITTFGVIVNSSDVFQAYQTEKNEYQAPTGTDKLDIYAAIVDNNVLVTPVLSGSTQNVKIYLVDYKAGATAEEKAAFPITESSLAEAIAETSAGTEIITYTDITTDGTTHFSAAPSAVTTVPGADGSNITGTHAVKLAGIKGTANTTKYYAVEYLTGKWNNDGGKTYADASAFSAAGTLYTTAACDDNQVASSWVEGTTYYKRTTTKNVYKIIKVVIPAAS